MQRQRIRHFNTQATWFMDPDTIWIFHNLSATLPVEKTTSSHGTAHIQHLHICLPETKWCSVKSKNLPRVLRVPGLIFKDVVAHIAVINVKLIHMSCHSLLINEHFWYIWTIATILIKQCILLVVALRLLMIAFGHAHSYICKQIVLP